MKIAISATTGEPDAQVDPRFGRAAWFFLIDTETGTQEALSNANQALGGGAGIRTAEWLASQGVELVLTGHCGPNAQQTLAAARIPALEGCCGPVAEVLARYRHGELSAPAAHPAPPAGQP